MTSEVTVQMSVIFSHPTGTLRGQSIELSQGSKTHSKTPHRPNRAYHIDLPLRPICICVSRVTLEKRSSNATPLVATRQDIPLDPIVEAVLYGWWYGYAYTSVSRALLYTSNLRDLGCFPGFPPRYGIFLAVCTPHDCRYFGTPTP